MKLKLHWIKKIYIWDQLKNYSNKSVHFFFNLLIYVNRTKFINGSLFMSSGIKFNRNPSDITTSAIYIEKLQFCIPINNKIYFQINIIKIIDKILYNK